MWRALLILLVIVLIAAAAFAVWRRFVYQAPALNIVSVSGRIEGDDSAIATKIAGRIVVLHYREGDTVRAGDVIAVLDDAQLRAQEEQARASLMDAQFKASSARAQIAIFEAQAAQSEYQVAQARGDAAGRVSQARADLAAGKSTVAQQKATYDSEAFTQRAYIKLASQGYISEQARVGAVTAAHGQANAVEAAERQVAAAEGALVTAKATLSNTNIYGAARSAIERQIAQQASQISSANAQVSEARASLTVAQANYHDLTIRAPFDGTVITRAAEPGEVVTAGTAIMTLLDLRKVYLRGYVPEEQIGNIKVGQRSRIFLDSNPNQPVDAYVLRIDPQATFTPENTYFRSDRVRQVFGLKLALRSGFGFAKPGMPADGEILTSGAWPGAGRTP